MEQDEIMIKIKNEAYDLNIAPIDAIIKDDTIIPGNIGKEVNLEASYKSMKKLSSYDASLLIYEAIYPNNSI